MEQLTDDENDDRQGVLLTDIEKIRLNYLVGCGQLDDWQEYSYLVLGIDQDQATAMAARFEQNALCLDRARRYSGTHHYGLDVP